MDVSVSLAIGWWLRTRPPLFNYRSALHLESKAMRVIGEEDAGTGDMAERVGL